MKRFICSMYNGLYYKGCKASVSEKGFYIKMLFTNILEVPIENIKKIVVFKKGNRFKLEYNNGTIKNEIVDLRIIRKKSFILHISNLGWPMETREKYKKEIDY